jgi:hypothetical protein
MRRLAFSDVAGCVVFGARREERIGDNCDGLTVLAWPHEHLTAAR